MDLASIEKQPIQFVENSLKFFRDGGTIAFRLIVEGKESADIFLNRKIGSDSKDEFYLGYPGYSESKRLGESEVLKTALMGYLEKRKR